MEAIAWPITYLTQNTIGVWVSQVISCQDFTGASELMQDEVSHQAVGKRLKISSAAGFSIKENTFHD
jgi:hypothetical protein